MKYSGFITVESKACEGVRFVIKKMAVRRRDRLEEIQAPINAKLGPLREELRPLAAEYRAAVESAKTAGVEPAVSEEKVRKAIELSPAISRIDRGELTPAAVRFALESIEVLEINGEPATLDLLLENGPDDLYQEIAAAVAREMGLLPEEQENLASPSTSAAAVDGITNPGSAGPVAMPDTTISAGAPSITVLGSATVQGP